MQKTQEALYELAVGKKLGEGLSRSVYVCDFYTEAVLKIEDLSQKIFQNVLEFKTWQEVEYTSLEKFFARCWMISEDGSVLLQERTRPASPQELVKKLPEFFGDIKPENWGIIKRENKELLVCHDYGYVNILTKGLKSKKLKKINW
jgi:hypothetical protein